MGVTISFRGSLAEPERVDEMVRAVASLVEQKGWRKQSVAELMALGHIKAEGLRGITVSVASRCEPVHLHVDGEGRFVDYMFYSCMHDPATRARVLQLMRGSQPIILGRLPDDVSLPESPPDDPDVFIREGLSHNWTKTQHGGVDAHVDVCTLLRFVRDRFAPTLEVDDPTGYFESGDPEEVIRQMEETNQAIRATTRAIERMRKEGGVTSIEAFLSTLMRYIGEERAQKN